MKALRFHGQKDLRYESVPIPEVKDGQVKVSFKYAVVTECSAEYSVQKFGFGEFSANMGNQQLRPAWVGICGTGNGAASPSLF
jgi:hypothetical protein